MNTTGGQVIEVKENKNLAVLDRIVMDEMSQEMYLLVRMRGYHRAIVKYSSTSGNYLGSLDLNVTLDSEVNNAVLEKDQFGYPINLFV